MNALKKSYEQNYFKSLPIDKMSPEFIKRFNKFVDNLKEFGIFIVPKGELEQWLKDKDYDESQEEFIAILKKIDRTSIPTNDDVWKFIEDINIWISNPKKKGML